MKRWPTKPLGEICELVNGAPFKPSDWDGAGLPIIRIQNLNDGAKPFNYTSKKLAEKFRVHPGDTLLSWSGTPGTSFGCFRWGGPEGWLNQHIFNVHLSDEVLPPFFIHQVNSKLEEIISKAHGGVGLQHITKGALSAVIVSVPPLVEQDRILKLLDEADELRKLRAQADRHATTLIPALFHEMFGDPLVNPNRWSIEELKSVCIIGDGNHSSNYPKASEMLPNGIPFIRAANLQDGEFDDTDMRFISPEKHQNLKKGHLKAGDVLFSNRGEIGKLAIVPQRFHDSNLNSQLAWIRPKEKLIPEYLFSLLASDSYQAGFRRTQQGAALQQLTIKQLSEVRILLPPLPLQKEFAQLVTELRELKYRQATSRTRLNTLFQSMLHRAFKGEL